MYSATTLLVALVLLSIGIPEGVQARCDTDAHCRYKVFGIGIYYMDLHSIRFDSSTFFLSYQLTILQRTQLFNSPDEAKQQVNPDFSCKNDPSSRHSGLWKPWVTDQDQLLFPNRDPTRSSIDTDDNMTGRYFVSGTHYFEPTYASYPYHSSNLTVSLELRDQTSTAVDEGLRNASIFFCNLKSYSAFLTNKALSDYAGKSGSASLHGVSVHVYPVCWPRLGTDFKTTDDCSPHELSQRFTATIPFRFDKQKRMYIAVSRSVIVVILALLSYFLPPSCAGNKSSFLFSAVLNMAFAQSKSSSTLFKSPTWTSVNYLDTTTIVFLGITIAHYILVVWMARKSKNLDKEKKFEKAQREGGHKQATLVYILWQWNFWLAVSMSVLALILFISVFEGALEKYDEPDESEMDKRKTAFTVAMVLLSVIPTVFVPIVLGYIFCNVHQHFWEKGHGESTGHQTSKEMVNFYDVNQEPHSASTAGTSSPPASTDRPGGGGGGASRHNVRYGMFTMLCIFICVMSVATAQPNNDDSTHCQVIGIGMYFFDLNEVSVKSGRFFASYQLIIKEHERLYNDCTEAKSKAIYQDKGFCKMDTDQDPAWKHWGEYDGVTNGHSKNQLLFLNVPSKADIDDIDRARGRYLVKGTHRFTPEYQGYPFVKLELGVKIQIRNQTLPENTTEETTEPPTIANTTSMDPSTSSENAMNATSSGSKTNMAVTASSSQAATTALPSTTAGAVPAKNSVNITRRRIIFCTLKSFSGVQKDIQLIENSATESKFFFNVDERYCWPPLSNVGRCDDKFSGEESPQFYGFIEYQWYEEKATLSALSPVIIIIILAMLSYILPPKENGQRFGLFLAGIITIGVSQSNNLDSLLSEVPSYTRVAYANIVAIAIIFIAAAHGVFMANADFWLAERPKEDSNSPGNDQNVPANTKEDIKKVIKEIEKAKDDKEKDTDKKLKQMLVKMGVPALMQHFFSALLLLLLCALIKSNQIDDIYIATHVILGFFGLFVPILFVFILEDNKPRQLAWGCVILFLVDLAMTIAVAVCIGKNQL